MEVKPGYKQTEVGVIPEEWEVAPLGELSSCFSGGTPSTSNSSYYGGDIPWITSSDLNRGRINEVEGRITEEGLANSAAKMVNKDSLLLALYGATAGVSAVTAIRAAINQAVLAIVPKSTNTEFLFQLLKYKKDFYITTYTQGGQPNFSGEIVKSFAIPCPTLPEQRAIATALSDVDGLLGGLDRLIAKKRDLKQAAMQQLLTGQTRLPGFHAEWEVKTLFELAAQKKELFDDGDWIESEHITTEGIRLIQTGNIGVGSFVEKDDKKYINEASFASLRCKQLKQGDLLVCRLADPAGRACVLGEIGEERIVTSVDVTIFRPPSELADRLFLSQVFSTSDWFRAVSDRSGGTTHKRISRGALGRLSINLPPLAEQTAIATVLSEMDGELAELDQRREKTRALKQAMMQELLTGRIRLIGKN
jgi:type I restriction enzyme S subunit